MLNQLLLQGIVLFGSVDQVDREVATIEYSINNEILYVVIPIKNSPCQLEESMEVLFTSTVVLKCLCSE